MEEGKMRVEWFENPDNVAYVDIEQFADNFGKELGINDLKKKIEDFKANPVKEGTDYRGTKRTSIKLFIPDMVFDKHIEMGETVWLYVGETYPAYSIYWNE